ncbi:S-adenosyl-L-methionine-dependent methyltransferase [Fusarium oxysporum f. sp. albedinis]|nr:S-adenosyl-L-methionine-dependent methyltransferase [Fusarium oxysporum f. sp. albedinis]
MSYDHTYKGSLRGPLYSFMPHPKYSITIEQALASVVAAPATLQLLRELHSEALAEPAYVSTDSQPASAALDRFVALEPEKCAIVYLLLRASGATNIVEAGTSFGVSTIYLALAAKQNALLKNVSAKVIATENESTKAIRAQENWKRSDSSDDVSGCIDLREGDLKETLKTDLPEPIDFLLLDIWSALALPTLQVVQPRLKKGALIVADNIISSAAGYTDLVDYPSDKNNGFRTTTAPYDGGLLIAVYTG